MDQLKLFIYRFSFRFDSLHHTFHLGHLLSWYYYRVFMVLQLSCNVLRQHYLLNFDKKDFCSYPFLVIHLFLYLQYMGGALVLIGAFLPLILYVVIYHLDRQPYLLLLQMVQFMLLANLDCKNYHLIIWLLAVINLLWDLNSLFFHILMFKHLRLVDHLNWAK